MRLHKFGALAVAAVLGASTMGLSAHGQEMVDGEAAVAAIKYRQGIMRSIAGHMGSIGPVLQQQVPYSGHVQGHAEAIRALSVMYDEIFPPGSEKGETRLKAEFFSDEVGARAIIKTFQEEAAKLVEVAASGDLSAVGPQLGKIGAQCGACHTAYRK